MNQEIKNAVRNSSLPPATAPANDFEALLIEPRTIATLGAAIATCPHPAGPTQVDAEVQKDGKADTIRWCSCCGAIGVDFADPTPENPSKLGTYWERPSLVQLVTFGQLNEVARVRTILDLMVASTRELGDQAQRGQDPADIVAGCRELETAVHTLVSLAIFAEIRRTKRAREDLAGREGVGAEIE